MLKKTLTYPDLDGNDVVEDFYFNLNKAEIAEMEISAKGGLSAQLEKLIESEDGATIIKTFKEILLTAIGKRSEDNRRFIKNQEIRDDFLSSEAYSTLFMELIQNPDASVEFIKGIVPADMRGAMDNAKPTTDVALPEEQPAWIKENRDPTSAEMKTMTQAQLIEAFARKNAPASLPDPT